MRNKQVQTDLESRLFRGLADTSRLSILESILTGPATVSQIVKTTGLSQPNTSAHLSCLLECGLVRKKRQGREVFYRIAMKEAAEIIFLGRKILRNHAKGIGQCAELCEKSSCRQKPNP